MHDHTFEFLKENESGELNAEEFEKFLTQFYKNQLEILQKKAET